MLYIPGFFPLIEALHGETFISKMYLSFIAENEICLLFDYPTTMKFCLDAMNSLSVT